MDEKPLTQKQEAFALAYVETGNAAEAYRRAYDVKPTVRVPSGFYVYCLVDNDTGQIHYVGKGKGGRMHQHLQAYRAGRVDTIKKYEGIDRIFGEGSTLSAMCIEDAMVEVAALKFEIALIRRIGVKNLLNSMHGQTPKCVRAAYDAGRVIDGLNFWAGKGGCKGIMALSLIPEAQAALNMANVQIEGLSS